MAARSPAPASQVPPKGAGSDTSSELPDLDVLESRRRPWLPPVALILGLAGVYYGAAKLGLQFAFDNASATAIWPPTGIALAALLYFGRRVWPAVFLGAFFANFTTQGTVLTSLGIATGNTLEGVLGAYLVARFARGTNAFERAADVVRFVLLAAATSTLVSATIGLTTLLLGGFVDPDAYVRVWITWWLGDAVGALVVAPLLLLWAQRPALLLVWRRRWEALVAMAILLGVSILAFVGFGGSITAPHSFLAIPVLVWAAFRFGSAGATAATFLLSAVAIVGTLQGRGPFGIYEPGTSLIFVQAFVGVSAGLALGVAAVVRERDRVEEDLRRSQETLERRVVKRTESLARSQKQLEESQQIAHVGSWEWDVAANRVTWSDELFRIYGQGADKFEASYEGYLRTIHPEDQEFADAVIQQALRDHKPFEFEHRILRGDDAVRTLHSRGRVHLDPGGVPVRMSGTAQDITEHREAEAERAAAREKLGELERLRELDHFRTAFMNMAAHELGTPLTPLKLQVHNLRAQLEGIGSKKTAESFEILERNIDRLHALVKDLLDGARLHADRLILDRKVENVSALVRDAVESFRAAAKAQEVQLEAKLEDPLPADVDAKRLGQVLYNLLSNALKFTPTGGRIAVTARAVADGSRIDVQDTGIGIRPEDEHRLFQPFSQIQGRRSEARAGTGLGLYISRGIVELHGGTLEYRPNGAEPGATFVIKLPRPRARARGPPAAEPAQVGS